MRTGSKLVTIGLAFCISGVAGCASTTSSSTGALQDDVPASVASEPGSPASESPPVASTGPSQSSAPAPAEPTAAPASSGPPLLGSSSDGPCDNGMEYSCGDTGPAGGIIVYVIRDGFSLSNGYSAACSNDCNYLEAQPSALPGSYPWCVGPGATTSVSPGTGGAIGTGYSNTQTIATFSGYCSSSAAGAALASSFGGYTDWFLPAQNELNELDNNGPKKVSGFYWTSSQSGPNEADSGYLGGGDCCAQKGTKTTPANVWAMRAF